MDESHILGAAIGIILISFQSASLVYYNTVSYNLPVGIYHQRRPQFFEMNKKVNRSGSETPIARLRGFAKPSQSPQS